MKEIKNIIRFGLKHKYVITSIVFVFYLVFFAEYSLIFQKFQREELSEIKGRIEEYKTNIEENKIRFKELKTSKQNLEKFAREQYLMHRKGEDVYLIVKK